MAETHDADVLTAGGAAVGRDAARFVDLSHGVVVRWRSVNMRVRVTMSACQSVEPDGAMPEMWRLRMARRDLELAVREVVVAHFGLVSAAVSRLLGEVPWNARVCHRDVLQAVWRLEMAGVEALIGAVDRFDPDAGVPFPVFAEGVVWDAVQLAAAEVVSDG